MLSIKFRAGNAWPLLRVMEAAKDEDSKLLGVSDDEIHIIKDVMASCLIHQESGSVRFGKCSAASLSIVMKALDSLAQKSKALLGEENGCRGAAQARSLRQKILEIKTRLDLTGVL